MMTLLKKAGAAALLLGIAAQAAALSMNGAGSTFIYPLASKWFYAYKEKTGVEINYQSIGSGAGINSYRQNRGFRRHRRPDDPGRSRPRLAATSSISPPPWVRAVVAYNIPMWHPLRT